MILKINFVDFWGSFQKTNNYFYHLLSTKYEVLIDEQDPDVVFFSVDYGKEKNILKYKNHRATKIFFTGENIRPNFSDENGIEYSKYFISKCDASLSFDFMPGYKNYRLPLWVLYIDWFNVGGYGDPKYLLPTNELYDNDFIKKPKKKFCCIVVSNQTQLRSELFDKLSKYKTVDGFGDAFNNRIQHGEYSKYEVLSDYKFSVCFENSLSPLKGYYTEKLLHAKTAGTIPLYYSDDLCKSDFNEKAFINLSSFSNMNDFIEYIKLVDNDEKLYSSILNEPLFKNKQIPDEFQPKNILKFIERVL